MARMALTLYSIDMHKKEKLKFEVLAYINQQNLEIHVNICDTERVHVLNIYMHLSVTTPFNNTIS